MFAMRSSETRIFPVATIAPAMGCGTTVSVSMAWLAADSEVVAAACPLAGLAGASAVFLQPLHTTVKSAASKKVRRLRRKNISDILSHAPLLLQRRCGRHFKIE